MHNTTQKTNQRMPGRSAQVVGNEIGRPSKSPAVKPAVTPKPVIKLKKKAKH